ncbi:transposase [Yimella sp. cx-51]|uniref:transposase n=1 Tax=Yimella sp. cx-51 TaxID=2770551 RepID=UPI001FCC27B8|nr:transposase [Yimella sp. cx-51]
MVDLTPDPNGHNRTRLLDLVPGRSGKAYTEWLNQRGQDFRDGIHIATLDPFRGYKNAQLLALLPAVVEVLQVQRCTRFKISWHLGIVTSPTDNGRAPVQSGGVALLAAFPDVATRDPRP